MNSYSTMENGLGSDATPLVKSKHDSKTKKAAATLFVVAAAFALGFVAASAVAPTATRSPSKLVVYETPEDYAEVQRVSETFYASDILEPNDVEAVLQAEPLDAATVFGAHAPFTMIAKGDTPLDVEIYTPAWGNWSSPPEVVVDSPGATIWFVPTDGKDGTFDSDLFRVDEAVYNSCNEDDGKIANLGTAGWEMLGITYYDWPCMTPECPRSDRTEYYISGHMWDDLTDWPDCKNGKKLKIIYDTDPVALKEKQNLVKCFEANSCPSGLLQPLAHSVPNSTTCTDYGAGGALGEADICADAYDYVNEPCPACADLGQAVAEAVMQYSVKNYQEFEWRDAVTGIPQSKNVPGIECNCKDMCWYDTHGQGYDEHTCHDPAAATTNLMVFPRGAPPPKARRGP